MQFMATVVLMVSVPCFGAGLYHVEVLWHASRMRNLLFGLSAFGVFLEALLVIAIFRRRIQDMFSELHKSLEALQAIPLPVVQHFDRLQNAGTAKDSAKLRTHPTMQICKTHKLFEGHSVMQLAAVLSKTQEVNMRPGDALFEFGDDGTSLFILLSGELSCITRDNKEVKVLQAGMLASLPLVWVRTWLP